MVPSKRAKPLADMQRVDLDRQDLDLAAEGTAVVSAKRYELDAQGLAAARLAFNCEADRVPSRRVLGWRRMQDAKSKILWCGFVCVFFFDGVGIPWEELGE